MVGKATFCFRHALYATIWSLLFIPDVSNAGLCSAFSIHHHLDTHPATFRFRSRNPTMRSSINARDVSKLQLAQKDERPVSFFLENLWKGVTLPFPILRRIVLGSSSTTGGKALSVGLTPKECILALMTYLTIGVVAYHRVLEQWPIADALYFTCVCFSTVGYGDLCPSTPASKVFTCLFGMGGIAFLGAAVATIGQSVVQAEVEAINAAKRESHKRIMQIFEGMPHVLSRFRQDPMSEPAGPLSTDVWRNPYTASVHCMGLALKFIRRITPSLVIIFGGAAIVQRLNGSQWSRLDSLYYALITASTIGFGDFAPTTKASRLFAVLYIPLSVAAAGELLSGAATALIERRQKLVYEEQLQRDLTMDHLQAMDADKDGKVSREEYTQFMLMEMGRVSKEELTDLDTQFERLDVTRSGYLDHDDLKLMAKLRGATVKD